MARRHNLTDGVRMGVNTWRGALMMAWLRLGNHAADEASRLFGSDSDPKGRTGWLTQPVLR